MPRNRELDPHLEAGFSGGLDVGVAARFTDGSQELWTGRWAVTMPKHPKQLIWSVQFTGVALHRASDDGAVLNVAAQRLGRALDDVSEYAESSQLEYWRSVFQRARAQLTAETPEIPYHADMLPPNGYSLDARRLVAAASTAWVFGGMGSWNDIADGDAERYRAVTVELFESVLEAVLAGTNSSAPRT